MQLNNPNAFATEPLDRAGKKRSDAAWLEAALKDPATRLLPFHAKRPLVREENGAPMPLWRAPPLRDASAVIFLGLDDEGRAHFAFDTDAPEAFASEGEFLELMTSAARYTPRDLTMVGAAKAVFEWHSRHRFCANCGAPTQMVEAGWRRDCDQCKAQHFPRVDPVVIMLPVYRDRCLLGRNARFPQGLISALAGFVEPGETLASAVARETLEEVGLKAVSLQFHSTQPWPFPSSLMIGALCEVENDQVTLDLDEIADAHWFTKDEIKLLLKGELPGFFAPPPHAIAHQLMKAWIGA